MAEFGLDSGAVGEDLMALDDVLTPILDPDGEIEASAKIATLALQLYAVNRWYQQASDSWSCATAAAVGEEIATYSVVMERLGAELDAACAEHPALESVREALRAEIWGVDAPTDLGTFEDFGTGNLRELAEPLKP